MSIEKLRKTGWVRLRLNLELKAGLNVVKTEFVVWRLFGKSTWKKPPVGRFSVAPTLYVRVRVRGLVAPAKALLGGWVTEPWLTVEFRRGS